MKTILGLSMAALLLACQSKQTEPAESEHPVETQETTKAPPPKASGTSAASARVKKDRAPRKIEAKPVAEVTPSPDDPLKGKFTLEDATKGLTGKGSLVAEIKTSLGDLSCDLYDDKAPITVANFIGLARGLRPFKDPSGEWVKKHGYDGTTFHRVVKGFMIQGGDPKGTGGGEPGYVIPDEVWEDAHHDRVGQLCMANRGANTNGMQFFIMDGKAAHLDGGYTIFGMCGPEEVIEKIASVETKGDKAVDPPKIEKVTIKRSAKPKPAASGVPSSSSAPAKPPTPAPSGS